MSADLEALIQQAAKQYNLPPDVFRRQLIAESGLNTQAVSPAGARGVAQLMPATAQAFGVDPMNPAQAIPAAALYMRQNLNRYGDDWQKALAAYNWGPGNLAKYGIAAAPPETTRYITKVLGNGPLAVTAQASPQGQGQPSPQMPPGPAPVPAGPTGPIGPAPAPAVVPPPPSPEAMGGGSLANMLAQLAQQGRDINKIV